MTEFKKFNQTLAQYQQEINSELERFFDQKIKDSFLISEETTETIKILKDYAFRGGKRLRAILVILGYFLAGGRNKKEIFKTSLTVELIHNFLLIHDDIIDQDELRRGQPSLHYFYQKKFSNNPHFGVSLAMVAGNISNVLGYEILAKSKFPDNLKIKAINISNEMVEKTCHGEMLELILKEKENTEKDILNIYKHKTAHYTLIAPLKIGATLAGQNNGFLNQLEKFALPLGIAFQIQDDILGLFGSQEEIGKPVASDIKENQPNLLIFKTLALAEFKDKQKFRRYLGLPKISGKDIEEIREITKKSGSLRYCQEKSGNLIKKSKRFLNKIKASEKEKQFLSNLADYIIRRNY